MNLLNDLDISANEKLFSSTFEDPIMDFFKKFQDLAISKQAFVKVKKLTKDVIFLELKNSATLVTMFVEKHKSSISCESFLPMVLSDLIAKYVGFHQTNLQQIFETLLCCSPKIKKKFSYWHHHVAVEPFSHFKNVLFAWKLRRLKGEFPCPNANLLQFSTKSMLPEECYKEDTDGNPFDETDNNKSIYDFISMLLYWSLIYKNEELQQGLWAYLYLEPDLFCPEHWNSRFMASIHLRNYELFCSLLTNFKKDLRLDRGWRSSPIAEKETILLQVLLSQMPCNSKKKREFILRLLEEGLLFSTRDLVLLAYQKGDIEMQTALLKNLQASEMLSVSRLLHDDGDQKSSSVEQWQETLAIFQAQAYKKVIDMYQNPSEDWLEENVGKITNKRRGRKKMGRGQEPLSDWPANTSYLTKERFLE